ncbi:hypothetical protein SK128_021469 [Halocaridina rubra]|uniref:Uncharacterized protein n=1 Tax=Halocaridina rubra TaxID=373956 RepID=A0AAN8X9F8_HALRR
MRQAMGQVPATKKEIYIKTSTGEFRFEGISQTFTKRLYEWEERRGIRPESSTIALLDPNYKAPEKENQEKPRSPELMRLVRSKSESSIAADMVVTSPNSHPSSLSLHDMEQEEGGIQVESKAASEPTLAGEECTTPKVAVLVQLEEVVDEGGSPSFNHPTTPYAPAEITRNIDSSGSEEDVTRRKLVDDDEAIFMNLNPLDSARDQGTYRSLLQENISLMDKLRQKEDLCRALEHQMGDIDTKMDNVADQHLRTLEKLHRQVTIIMKDSGSVPTEEGDFLFMANDDPEANQRLINQLRARIAELEMQSDHLKEEKEQLEMAFKLHKEQETEIAESLVIRIRELQDAGAEVNIQTVQCQTDDLPNIMEKGQADPIHSLQEESHEELGTKSETMNPSREFVVAKIKESSERREHRSREHRKVRKAPPKKVQKLHNLTGDLLFQAKRLEQALVSKHGLEKRGDSHTNTGHPHVHQHRSLRGRSSLRLAGDVSISQRRQREQTARTWSSIEAITVPSESPSQDAGTKDLIGSGSLEGKQSSESFGGLVTSSRSLRLPSSMHSCDPQDLLAMNAELSRMAKELRVEMMKMWSFRESTSPESETSECIEKQCREGDKSMPRDSSLCETDRLVAEANEVFQSIALLKREEGSPSSPHASRSPSTQSRRSPSTLSLSKRRESGGYEDKLSRRNPEKERSRSSTVSSSKRNSSRQQKQEEYDDDEEDEVPGSKECLYMSSGPTLDELIKRSQIDDEVDRGWEGARRRSSDGLSTVTSGPSRSHSPSPSIASSAPEAETSSRLDETEDTISLSGTWKTATTSTVKSGEHILSSSFEWEDENHDEKNRLKGKWKTEDEKDNSTSFKRRLKNLQQASEGNKSFETEVTTTSPIAGRNLKTRRISDTQVEYDSFGQSKRDECFVNTFSRTVYDDEALTAGRLSRNPSVRKANSQDREETFWKRLRSMPSTASQDFSHIDRSPDVFVQTKRTIFTVQGGALNSDQARATPTFVENQEYALTSPKLTRRDSKKLDAQKITEIPTENKTNISHCEEKTKHVEEAKNILLPKTSTPLHSPSMVLSEKERLKTKKDKESNDEITGNESIISIKPLLPLTETETTRDVPHAEAVNEESKNNNIKNHDDSKDEIKRVSRTPSPSPNRQSSHSPRQITPVQLPMHTPMVAMLFQMSPPTSPPIESKRKVLEAVNEGVPTVRNIIQKFNQRITENQELLGSPFRSPPTSPPWQSPRSQRRIIADLAKGSQIIKTQKQTEVSANINSSGVVQKSLSTSVLMKTDVQSHIQRSASSSLVQNADSSNEIYSTSDIKVSPPETASVNIPSTGKLWQVSPEMTPTITPQTSPFVSPAITPGPTDTDTSYYDLDVSLDDPSFQGLPTGSNQTGDKSPSGRLRAIKIKKARDEFLLRGVSPLSPERSCSPDSLKMRHRSGTASTDESWRNSGEISGRTPSPCPTMSRVDEALNEEENHDRPPKAALRRSRILKKESFRRQSAGCLLEESAPDHSVHVVKSTSIGELKSAERQHRHSVDTESRESRKSSIEPSIDSGKSPRGFFKLFRRHRSRDKKDMPSVQKLCRQSLLVDFAVGRNRAQSATQQPSGSQLFALPELDGEEPLNTPRTSKTLPRGSSGESVPLAPSRSCPSSPVAPHRSRTANWLARGRQIFKSRSPSPSKKAR